MWKGWKRLRGNVNNFVEKKRDEPSFHGRMWKSTLVDIFDQIVDAELEVVVHAHFVFHLLNGVVYGGMVSAVELLADFGERHGVI